MSAIGERAPQVALRVGSGLGQASPGPASAYQGARRTVFAATGVTIPEAQIIMDSTLDPHGWVLSAAGETRTGVVAAQPLKAGGAEGDPLEQDMARELEALAARFVSKQLVSHYLDLLGRDQPRLVEAVRHLVGLDRLCQELSDRVAGGQSIRHLPPVLGELAERAAS